MTGHYNIFIMSYIMLIRHCVVSSSISRCPSHRN